MDPRSFLDGVIGGKTPGLQYLALNASGPIFEYCGGFADIRQGRAMDAATTLNAYSMTKTITAAAVMRLAQARLLALDDPGARYFSDWPYDSSITIRHLLTHTAGLPNPIPLRWVHLATQHTDFNEDAALRAVLKKHPRTVAFPGTRFMYSNIGYWLLGPIVAKAAGQPFEQFVEREVMLPLGITSRELSFTVPDAARQAQGYLEKYSVMNLLKGLLIDRELIGGYEDRWLRIESHYVNGPAFGGLIGTARAFGKFLQDQLQPHSALLDDATRNLFYEPQRSRSGALLRMTPGWHVGKLGSQRHFFKEGGGGGFHCTMRVYADAGIASIVMANATGFNSNACLDQVDPSFL